MTHEVGNFEPILQMITMTCRLHGLVGGAWAGATRTWWEFWVPTSFSSTLAVLNALAASVKWMMYFLGKGALRTV